MLAIRGPAAIGYLVTTAKIAQTVLVTLAASSKTAVAISGELAKTAYSKIAIFLEAGMTNTKALMQILLSEGVPREIVLEFIEAAVETYLDEGTVEDFLLYGLVGAGIEIIAGSEVTQKVIKDGVEELLDSVNDIVLSPEARELKRNARKNAKEVTEEHIERTVKTNAKENLEGGVGGVKLNKPVKIKTNKGIEVEFKNPSGNDIKWVEQNPKNIPNAIESAKNSSNAGKAIEGKVGDFVQQKTGVTGFGLKVEDVKTLKPAGDIDILTSKQIIEVKKSTSALDMDQIDKYVNPNNNKFFNNEMKEVVVYIDEPIDLTNKIIVEKIKLLELQGVKVVNSLEELGGVLK